MFCKSCGSEVKTGERFCSRCGAQIEGNNESTGGTAALNDLSDKIRAYTSKLGGALIGKLLILAALICFLFTFMSVSCADIKREITGKDLIFGNSTFMDSVNEKTGSDIGWFNIFVCLSALSGIAAIIIRKRKISSVLSGLSAILLLIFRATAKFYYKLDGQTLGEMEESGTDIGFKVGFGFPLYLAILLFAVASASIISAAYDKSSSLPPPDNTYTPTSDGGNNNNMSDIQ